MFICLRAILYCNFEEISHRFVLEKCLQCILDPSHKSVFLSLCSVTATSPQRCHVARDVMPTRRFLASFENRRLTSAVIACVAWLVLIRRRYCERRWRDVASALPRSWRLINVAVVGTVEFLNFWAKIVLKIMRTSPCITNAQKHHMINGRSLSRAYTHIFDALTVLISLLLIV